MPRKTFLLISLAGCLSLFLFLSFPASAAPVHAKIAQLTFNGTLSETDQTYLGLEKPGPFKLQDVKASYVLIEITRTT